MPQFPHESSKNHHHKSTEPTSVATEIAGFLDSSGHEDLRMLLQIGIKRRGADFLCSYNEEVGFGRIGCHQIFRIGLNVVVAEAATLTTGR